MISSLIFGLSLSVFGQIKHNIITDDLLAQKPSLAKAIYNSADPMLSCMPSKGDTYKKSVIVIKDSFSNALKKELLLLIGALGQTNNRPERIARVCTPNAEGEYNSRNVFFFENRCGKQDGNRRNNPILTFDNRGNLKTGLYSQYRTAIELRFDSDGNPVFNSDYNTYQFDSMNLVNYDYKIDAHRFIYFPVKDSNGNIKDGVTIVNAYEAHLDGGNNGHNHCALGDGCRRGSCGSTIGGYIGVWSFFKAPGRDRQADRYSSFRGNGFGGPYKANTIRKLYISNASSGYNSGGDNSIVHAAPVWKSLMNADPYMVRMRRKISGPQGANGFTTFSTPRQGRYEFGRPARGERNIQIQTGNISIEDDLNSVGADERKLIQNGTLYILNKVSY